MKFPFLEPREAFCCTVGHSVRVTLSGFGRHLYGGITGPGELKMTIHVIKPKL